MDESIPYNPYQQLNDAWASAEECMRLLKIPEAVSVETDAAGIRLAWQRYTPQGTWRICRVSTSYGGDAEEVKPMAEAKLEERIRLAQYLPLLFEAVLETRKRFLPRVQKAVSQILEACAKAEAAGKANR